MKFFYGYVAVIALCSHYVQASCCSQAASGGAGRLLPHERALVQLNNATRLSYARFDGRSNLTFGLPKHLPYLAFDQEVQMMFRLTRHFEPFAKVSSRVQKSAQAVGANVGNSLIGARIPLSRQGLWGLSSIFMVASLDIPSGVVSGQNQEYRPEYITSMGVHMLNAGLFFEKSFAPFNLVLGYNFSAESPFSRSQVRQGQIHSPSLAMNMSLDETNFLAAQVATTFVTSVKNVVDSSKRKIALSVSYSKKIHSHITLLATVGSDVPVAYLGTNFMNEAFVNIGMRLGVF